MLGGQCLQGPALILLSCCDPAPQRCKLADIRLATLHMALPDRVQDHRPEVGPSRGAHTSNLEFKLGIDIRERAAESADEHHDAIVIGGFLWQHDFAPCVYRRSPWLDQKEFK
jgi:hypothetical protein